MYTDHNKDYRETSGPAEYYLPAVRRRKSRVGIKIAVLFMAIVLSFGSLGIGAGLGMGLYQSHFAKESQSPTINAYSLLNSNVSLPETAIVSVVSQVSASVVSINTVSTVNNLFYGAITQNSAGSGIIFYEDESRIYIVTNNHVIENSNSITVSIDDSTQVPAAILGRDSQSDIAVVTVNKSDIGNDFKYKTASFANSDTVEIGQLVVAIGNAAGEGKSATLGIISARDKEIVTASGETKINVIQTDAAINPGNSGGALADMSGRIVGVNTAKLSEANIEGMGYAIPSDDVRRIAEEIVKNGTVDRPYLGIAAFDVTEDMIKAYSLPGLGVCVNSVSAGSGADDAGLRRGDIITEFNGTEVHTMTKLQELIAATKSGTTVSLKIYRNSQFITVNAQIKNANAVK